MTAERNLQPVELAVVVVVVGLLRSLGASCDVLFCAVALLLPARVQLPVQSVQSPLSHVADGGGTLAVKFAAHFAMQLWPLATFTQPWTDVLFAFSGVKTGAVVQGLPCTHGPPTHCSHFPLQQRACGGRLFAKNPTAQLAQQ
jgi:hypothetical protein